MVTVSSSMSTPPQTWESKKVARQAVIFGSEFHGFGDGGAVGQDAGERDGAFTGEEAVDVAGQMHMVAESVPNWNTTDGSVGLRLPM